MTQPILQTRILVPPLPPRQVPRQRLFERLQAGIGAGRRLTLVSAPPGSGKTTLLAGWAAQARERVAWLTLDAEQDEPVHFRDCLLAAFQAAVPGLGRNLSRGSSIPHLLNGLSGLPGRVVLVLDDYHVIGSPAVHEDVTLLLEGMPPALHLVLATRADPPLPIARLRARGQLNEIRGADLRFSVPETAAFLLESMGLRLPAGDVETLEARTEGWIAGLQLAALSMQGRDNPQEFIATFTGGHHHLQEYLAGEVIDRQPGSTREFLIQTSILDQLSGSLCSAVTGNAESAGLLSGLEHGNLFTVALDDEHGWYRYHALFAEALRRRLQQTCPVEQIAGLHLRASAWLEEHGAIAAAVRHARAAGDFERMARLAEQAARASRLDSRMTNLPGWVAALPEAVARAHPRLRVFQAWGLFMGGRFGPARRILVEVRQSLEELPPGAENDRLRDELAAWLGIMETLVAGFVQGFDGSLEQAMRAYQAARQGALEAGILSLAAVATEGLALAQYTRGHLHQSARSCREVIELGRRGADVPLPLAAAGHIELAGIYIEWNNLAEAGRQLRLGEALCRQGEDVTILAEAHLVQSRLYEISRDRESALEALRQADQALAGIPYSMTHFNLDMQRVGLLLAAGRLQDARHLLRELDENSAHAEFRPATLGETRRMAWVRLHLAGRQPQQALALVDELIGPAEAAGRHGRVMKLLVFRALARHMLGEAHSALAALGRALEMAEPEGFVRLFLDEGAPLMAQLRQAAAGGIAPAYAGRLLAAWTAESAAATPPPAAVLIAPLTPAELKVLRLIAEGCSNREITGQLVIALDTVKRHTSHIYRKLDVRSRTQAIVRARQLGLIPAQPVS
jgi:LuxR family maltose regulon positive regulatory protein